MEHAIKPAPASGNPVAQTPEGDLTGKRLGDYQVLRRLGEGGMGQVYLAEQVSLKRKVALKLLKTELASDPIALKRFQAEAEKVARITHANIVQVYAIGELGDLRWMALEYVEGRNLRDYLARKGPPEVPLALSIMRQVAAALQRAAEHGIVHRDIKPENILLTRKGEVKVADFGLLHCLPGSQEPLNLTQTGVTMGTPLYMSPEQVQGQTVDPRSDLYSFGATCYHMLTGNPPFRGETAFEVALQHVQAKPRPLCELRPDLPVDLCRVVDRMLAKKPEDRFQSARDLLKELNRLRGSLSGNIKATGTQTRVMSLSSSQPAALEETAAWPTLGSRHWLRPLAALTVVLALFGGAGLGWYRNRPPALAAGQTPPAPGGDKKKPPSQQDREQFLLRAVSEYSNPGTPAQVTAGWEHAIELGLFYLDQWRLEDADLFFDQLIKNTNHVKAYTNLGRLGRAIVLAFQNRPAVSNKLFLAVIIDGKQPELRTRMLLNEPRLRQMIAKALDYNAANNAAAKEPIPAQLQWLRRPPSLIVPAGGPHRAGPEK